MMPYFHLTFIMSQMGKENKYILHKEEIQVSNKEIQPHCSSSLIVEQCNRLMNIH